MATGKRLRHELVVAHGWGAEERCPARRLDRPGFLKKIA